MVHPLTEIRKPLTKEWMVYGVTLFTLSSPLKKICFDTVESLIGKIYGKDIFELGELILPVLDATLMFS